jgi:N-acetylmuramoyl-L-alanine amidase
MKATEKISRVAALLLCILLFPAAGASGPVFAADAEEELPPVSLRINEQFINTDVAPVIVEGRTLVPARAVFEALGGTVLWDDSGYPVQLVSVSCYGSVVNLTIGAAAAFVNGAETGLDVPAQIVNDRTLIPVRFVSESLGFVVRWNEDNRIVDIYSPDYEPPLIISKIESVDVTASDAGTRVSVTGNSLASNYLLGAPGPKQFSIGFPNAILEASMTALEWQREISIVRGVTAEQPALPGQPAPTQEPGEQLEQTAPLEQPEQPGVQEQSALPAPPESLEQSAPSEQPALPELPGTESAIETWFTLDLLEDATPALTSSPDGNTLYLDFPKPQIPFNPWGDGKLSVILDPGHGAETVGKRSPDGSVLEYAFNRDMAARVKAHLERHGVVTLLTVYDDADMSLEDRCKAANDSGADVFVSLHANAYGNGKTWTKQSGWEIFTYKKGSFSEQLANAIHDETIPASGLVDRGVKAERYYVIRNVNMPAALIEHGFYTNQTEIELLKSPEFRERLAVMDAKGILRFLGVQWMD